MDKNSFLLYKVENVENGRVYIGSTTSTIEKRKKDHIQKAKLEVGHQFQEAISSFGPEAFTWEQIDTAESINELAKKEKEYILEYNSKENGYNQDSGGGFKKSVYQYDLDTGELISEYGSLEVAANMIDSTKQHISRAALSINNVYGGFYWSYDFVEVFAPKKDERRKEVLQMNVEGKILATYLSVADASRQLGINKSSIAKCCRGERKTTGGFLWKYR